MGDEFSKKYTKNMKEYDTAPLPDAKQIVQEISETGEDLLAWRFSQEFDPMAFRVLMHSLRQSGYPKIKAIWVWKCNGGDELVRSVCYYLDMDPSPEVEDVQFMDNNLTPLGCEFLGRTLGPTGNKVINFLKLDYNQFGVPGVQKLSEGLAQNSTLRVLSLQYCDIGPGGGEHLALILMFIKSILEDLYLRGNRLGEEGVVNLFGGAKRAKCLRSIDLFDNKFCGTPEVIEGLRELFAHNTKLEKYDLGGNRITDEGAKDLITGMLGHSHLRTVLITEQCSVKTFEALEIQLGASKGKKKGKGKKK